MNIKVSKSTLLGALDKAFSVTSRSAALPVLQAVKMIVEDGSMVLIGSDNELVVRVRVDQLDILEEGEGLFPSRFHEIVKLCPDSDIRIESNEEVAIIQCDNARWDIHLEMDEYPELDLSHEPKATVPKSDLVAALNACKDVLASARIRPAYHFVQLSSEYARATDGARLHQVNFTLFDALLPARALGEITRRCRSMAVDEVEVGETERHLSFKFDDDLLFVTKQVTEYPDIDQHMLTPALAHESEFLVDRKGLIEATKRVALAANEDTNYLSIELRDDGSAFLKALDRQGNFASETVPVSWSHARREVGVNYDHLVSILSAMSGETVAVRIGEDSGPRRSSLCFRGGEFTGVLTQLRSNVGDAPKIREALDVDSVTTRVDPSFFEASVS